MIKKGEYIKAKLTPVLTPKMEKASTTECYRDFLFSLVPTKGIEPSHPCEWQILSLLRLPIPPHGLLQR